MKSCGRRTDPQSKPVRRGKKKILLIPKEVVLYQLVRGNENVSSAKQRKELAERIREVIADKYDEPKRRKVRPPLDQLVQGVLWRYTVVKSGIRSFRSLKRHFVDWNELRVSTVVEIASAMSTAAWAYECAGHLKQIMQALFNLRNVVKMDFLDDFTQSEARTFLRSLQGVTRDLADEVLLFNYGTGKIPLSDHASRMCFRMGLIEKTTTILKNQRALAEVLDEDYHVGFTLFLHDHARDVCCEKKPKHANCPMQKLCPKVGVDD